MNFIVFGCTGFIGSKIYDFLKSNPNNSVVGISSNEVDLSEASSYKKLQNFITPDCVLIMCVGVKKQLGDNIDIFEKNIVIINNFIRAVVAVIPNKIIFISSASVYGEDVVHSYKIDENTPVVNRSYYGMAKYMSELLLDKVCSEINTKLIILRPPLIYGDGDTSFGYGPTGFLRKAIDGEKNIMWGDGNELREFIYIDDVVNIINRLVNSEFEGILNIVSGKSYTYSDVIRIIKDNFCFDIDVVSRERSKEKVDHIFSNKLIKEVLINYKFIDLKSGMQLMYDSMQDLNKGSISLT